MSLPKHRGAGLLSHLEAPGACSPVSLPPPDQYFLRQGLALGVAGTSLSLPRVSGWLSLRTRGSRLFDWPHRLWCRVISGSLSPRVSVRVCLCFCLSLCFCAYLCGSLSFSHLVSLCLCVCLFLPLPGPVPTPGVSVSCYVCLPLSLELSLEVSVPFCLIVLFCLSVSYLFISPSLSPCSISFISLCRLSLCL